MKNEMFMFPKGTYSMENSYDLLIFISLKIVPCINSKSNNIGILLDLYF